MCGIMAWAGKSPKKFSKAKFDLLGSYNEERGIDSCGVATDGLISVGVNKNKVYRDFIVGIGYELPEDIPTVIGHTRKSTFGLNNEYNAHPFGFGVKDSKFRFIGVHNGSLINHKKLAEEFGIKMKAKYRIGKSQSEREKIDSEVLLEAIYVSKSFKPLSFYNGAAALVFQNVEEPNVIYCYHGKSKKWSYEAKEAKGEPERPLYYYKETRNSLYISSIEKSLEAIGGDKNTIGEFEYNVVYKITDGNIAKAEKFPIDRSENYHNESSYCPVTVTNNGKKNKHNNVTRHVHHRYPSEYYDNFYDELDALDNDDLPLQSACYSRNPQLNDRRVQFNIFTEEKPKLLYQNQVFVNRLRYWDGSKLAHGIYVWISSEFGFYYLGENFKAANEHFEFLVDKPFFSGEFCFSGETFTKDDGMYIPFPRLKKGETPQAPFAFMFKGVRVRNFSDFLICEELRIKNREFDWTSLTHCSTHPIVDIDASSKLSFQQFIKWNDKLVTDTFCPLGSNKIYTIENGNCVGIEDKKQYISRVDFEKQTEEEEKGSSNSSNKDADKDTLSIAMEALECYEEEIQANEMPLSKHENVEDKVVQDLIEDIFKLPINKLSLDVKRLERYGSNVEAQSAILIIEEFIKDISRLIDLEPKE